MPNVSREPCLVNLSAGTKLNKKRGFSEFLSNLFITFHPCTSSLSVVEYLHIHHLTPILSHSMTRLVEPSGEEYMSGEGYVSATVEGAQHQAEVAYEMVSFERFPRASVDTLN